MLFYTEFHLINKQLLPTYQFINHKIKYNNNTYTIHIHHSKFTIGIRTENIT